MTRRTSLAQRISLLAVAIAVITALIAGLLAVGLIRQENERNARSTLAQLADAAQSTADQAVSAQNGQQRARRLLLALKVQSATVNQQGRVTSTAPLAANALTAADVSTLLAGRPLSVTGRSSGQPVLVEGRPTAVGGIALVQLRTDATAAGERAIRRILLGLLVGVAIAVLLGLVVAYRIARPLRRTALVAHALAAGQRDVVVEVDGPTEVAEVGDAVNRLAAALSHSEGRQREFLLSVSHDLRTPLTAITGYAESLADGVVPTERMPEVGAVLLAESQRLTRLVADLLDLARLDAQDFRIEVVDVDVFELAAAAEQVWSARCASNGVRFELQMHGERVWISSDPGRLRQVVDGLLENALRVTPAGALIVLAAGTAADGSVVALEVRDGGPGLDESDLAVAFERSALFTKYRGVRQVGTGLGLAIVHGLVSRLGGTIEAGHAYEGGARFTVRLPLATAVLPATSVRPGPG
jgi:two-component system sensor histidine kinase BaeS